MKRFMPPLTRRVLLAGTAAAAAAPALAAAPASAADSAADLHWLDGVPAETAGTAWGLPWARGQLRPGAKLALATADGTGVPVQSWPLAYWPDGSLKWTGHAVGAHTAAERYRLTAGAPAAPAEPVTVRRSGDTIVLANGTVEVHVATRGDVVLPAIRRGDRGTATDGRLVLHVQDRPDDETGTPHRETYRGVVERAVIEQSGPVRAVIRLTGAYRRGDRKILPWTLRVYLAAGDAVRLVHGFTWDADANTDFVRGLGLEISVPLTDETYDRHVRFGVTGGGVWGEPVRGLTGLRRDPGAAVNTAQVQGTATPPIAEWNPQVSAGYQLLAQWNDFRIAQD